MIPSTGIVSPGSTRILSPILTCSAGTITSLSICNTLAVCGVRCTSFSIPALAFATVSSSNNAPNCMIKATSPAANVSPIQIEAISASETNTSAFISKAVTNPIMASKIIGNPHKITANHARSNGNGCT